jgi:hypothetical protein
MLTQRMLTYADVCRLLEAALLEMEEDAVLVLLLGSLAPVLPSEHHRLLDAIQATRLSHQVLNPKP